MLNKNFILMFVFAIFIFGFINAEVIETTNTPLVKQGDSYILEQFCTNSTYANISSIKMSSINMLSQTSMVEKSNDYYQYNFTNTNLTGLYSAVYYCDENGIIVGGKTDFLVTPTGEIMTLGYSFIQIILLLFFISLIIGFYYINKNIDFKKWNDSIIKKYQNKNFIKVIYSSITYNLLKNNFVIYYLIGFPIILTLIEMSYSYNLLNILATLKAFMVIYSLGVILVGAYLFSYVQEWIMEAAEQISNSKWGVE